MRRRAKPPRGAALAIVALLGSASARADGPAPLSFSADQVEGDPKLYQLVLRGHVVVTYERFRLTSPHLSLERTPRGVEVQGPGDVVFCPCPDPPLAIRFDSVLVAPPADLVLRHPRLLVGGTEVFGLPWFWLRSPSRVGLLPPVVAWRGGDGLLVGEGVHVPLHAGDSTDALDVTAGGYFRGGFELSGSLRTETSTAKVRWDHLEGDLLAMDMHGAVEAVGETTTAWDVDAIRGPRARRGTISLEDAARAYDRAAIEAMVRPGPALLFGGIRATGARGGSGPGEAPAWGPEAGVAASGALGDVGSWDALSTLAVLNDPALGATNLGRAEARVELDARPGPVLLELTNRGTATVADAPEAAGVDASDMTSLTASVPLVRAYGDEESEAPVAHVIAPRAQASYGAFDTRGAYWSQTGRPAALATGHVVAATAGAQTTWGPITGRSGATLRAEAGGIGVRSPTTPVVRWRMTWSSPLFAAGAEGAELGASPDGEQEGGPGQVTVARARLGEPQGFHWGVHAAGRSSVEPLLARTLASASAEEPSGGWLAAPGWSGGTEAGGRLGPAFHARVGADGDLSSRTLLGVRGAVGYAHPCKCLSVDAFVGHRLGRDGVDLWVSIDLAPP